ncbi:hypothetical protein PMAYCL1PPCAC_33110 [Pristionchus mayeri]|uniref:BED-type domain-containing protein n=1 Tax=Pristionchus mayeri TaxID=1317129 RepID=A0AAN5DHE0_9BILA|nr:hypothetical protein PMAYCL1PPCAC_33110 [Pristionchus mayeri]
MTPIQPCLRESKLSFSLFPFFSPIMVSSVWDHFTKDSYSDKATCNLCPATYCVKKGSTSNLWRHLEQKHPYCLTTSQAEFDQLCEKILRLCTLDKLLERIIDRPEFHALFPSSTRIPTRYHLLKVVKPSMEAALREALYQRLHDKRVSLSVDHWTMEGGSMTLYCINANLANHKGELESQLIPVSPSMGPPSPSSLRQTIDEIRMEFNVEIAAVVTPSDQSLAEAVKETGIFNPLCAAHELHEAVKTAVEGWSHSSILHPIIEFARSLNNSSTLREQYFALCTDCCLKQVGVPEYDDARWGSLFHSIERVNEQWMAVNATLKLNGSPALSDDTRLLLIKISYLLKPFHDFTTKMCSPSCLLTEVPFIFKEISHIMQSYMDDETGPIVELAELLRNEVQRRTVYYTENESMKKLLFFDPRAVEMFPSDWLSIGASLLPRVSLPSSSPPSTPSSSSPYSWCEKRVKREENTADDEVEKYIYECKRGSSINTNPLQYWTSPRGSFYPRIRELALKALPVPPMSIHAQRIFRAAGLLDMDHLSDSTAKEVNSRLLFRFSEIGEKAREISYLPPKTLVPQRSFTDNRPSSPVDETFGNFTDDSDFEETNGVVKEEIY